LNSGKTESKLEQAAKRLELAVTRLERAIGHAGGDAAESKRLVAALAEAKAEYSALEQTTSRVATRLDATIERLNAVLRA
jgi:hypothetical protein